MAAMTKTDLPLGEDVLAIHLGARLSSRCGPSIRGSTRRLMLRAGSRHHRAARQVPALQEARVAAEDQPHEILEQGSSIAVLGNSSVTRSRRSTLTRATVTIPLWIVDTK